MTKGRDRRIRSVRPTAGVVAAEYQKSGDTIEVPYQTWTTLWEETVENEAHECLFVWASATLYETTAGYGRLYGRLYDVTDGKYYPIDDVNSINERTGLNGTLIFQSAEFFFAIPKNVANHVLRFQVWHNINNVALDFVGHGVTWGFSPHTHR